MIEPKSGDGGNRTHATFLPIAVAALVALVLVPAAHARCRTHRCWQKVHTHRVERMVERRIVAITPFGPCYGGRWAVPCYIVGRESSGHWWALNLGTTATPCAHRACGPYQFLGWPVPWPVVVSSRYQTLKRKLAHHRMARHLWSQQMAGAACHWCY